MIGGYTRHTGLLIILALASASPSRAVAPPGVLSQAQQKRLQEQAHLFDLANDLQRQGKVRETIDAIRQALGIEREVFGRIRLLMCANLQRLADELEKSEEWNEARQAREEALAISRATLGEKHWRVLDARWELADHRTVSRLTPTRQREWRHANAQYELGVRRRQEGKSKEAIELLQRAFEIRKMVFGKEHPHCASTMGSLAMVYLDAGEPRRAQPLLDQALAIRQKALGTRHPAYAQTLNNLAVLHDQLGEREQAARLCLKALTVFEETVGEGTLAYANTLNNLATLYQNGGKYHLALPLLQRSLSLTRELVGDQHPSYAVSQSNLASLYRKLGEYRKALPLYQQAQSLIRKTLGERHPYFASSQNNLALLYRDMQEHRQALSLFEQTTRLTREAFGERHPNHALSLENLALVYQDLGEHRQALPLFEQVLQSKRVARGENHPSYAITLHNLAVLHRDMGRSVEALALCRQALAIFEETVGRRHPSYAISLHNLATLSRARGTSAAAPLAGQALAVARRQYDDTAAVLAESQRHVLLSYLSFYLDHFLSSSEGVPVSTLYQATLAFRGAFLATTLEDRLVGDDPAARALLSQLREARAALARLSARIPDTGDLSAWRRRFDEQETLLTDREEQFARHVAPLKPLRQVSTTAVTAQLPNRSTFVDFLVYRHFDFDFRRSRWTWERRLLAFVLRPGREPSLVRLGDAGPVDAAVRAWVASSTAQGSLGPDASAATWLRQRVWEPVAKHFDGVDTVLMAPDGELASLPFAALPGSKPGSFLLEEYAFGYVPSGRHLLLANLLTGGVEGSGLITVGGLDYGNCPPGGSAWAALPGTALECERIETTFGQVFPRAPVQRLGGEQADRVHLLGALEGKPRPRYLHMATHGFFERPTGALLPALLGPWAAGAGSATGIHGLCGALAGALVAQEPGVLDVHRGFDPSGRTDRVFARNPMATTGLVLAGANREVADGLLSALEISGLDLRGCELATLSACETGLGQRAGWQGVQGLQRGLHEAGVRHVVASLWNVHDGATSVLMEEFYDRLWRQKMSPLQALRQAQLEVLRHPDRIEKRNETLLAEARKRGVPEGHLRGPRPRATPLRIGDSWDSTTRRSPVSWWAGFVLSGNVR